MRPTVFASPNAANEGRPYLLVECLREMSRGKVSREQATITEFDHPPFSAPPSGRPASILAWVEVLDSRGRFLATRSAQVNIGEPIVTIYQVHGINQYPAVDS